MVLLETFAASSTYLTVTGLLALREYNFLTNANPSSKDRIFKSTDYHRLIRLTYDQRDIQFPTMLSLGTRAVGLSFPIGGGTTQVEEKLLLDKALHREEPAKSIHSKVLDFETYDDVELRYINTADDVTNFCTENHIQAFQFPFLFPMKLYTKTLGPKEPLYISKKYNMVGTSRDKLIRASVRASYKPQLAAAAFVAGFTGILIAIDWRDQRWRLNKFLGV